MRSSEKYVSKTGMNEIFKYRGKSLNQEDVNFISKLIAENPDDSRRKLSVKLCQAWNWVQKNGAFRDMVARGLILELHRAGHITLPPKKCSPKNPFVDRKKRPKITIDQTPFEKTIFQVKPLEFRKVRRTDKEILCDSLIEQHHYLGYCQPVGEHLKYIIYSGETPIACMTWSSAPYHIGVRDNFIGWPMDTRKKNLSLMAYNSRFLILPWVKVHNLASHILGQMARVLPKDWEQVYNHPIYYLETFVDTERFLGTCYKAANWVYLGNTTGRGIKEKTQRITRSIKAVWGYPLSPDFRKYLCHHPN